MKKVILITGCSSGIGHNLTLRLVQAGHTVIATARNIGSLAYLNVAETLRLDVTQPESIKQAVDAIIQKYSRIDVLVNNAGYAQVGAIEDLSDEQVYQLYDVNVFGVLRMVRAVLPVMRKQGSGRIINISSIAGKLVTPVNGAYSSSKSALEALSDALRLEVEPFNVQVIMIEPGAIKTNFDQTVHAFGDEITSNKTSPYYPLYQKYQQVADRMRGNEPGPEAVSRVVQTAIESSNPKVCYLAGVGLPVKAAIRFRDVVWKRAVRQLFKA